MLHLTPQSPAVLSLNGKPQQLLRHGAGAPEAVASSSVGGAADAVAPATLRVMRLLGAITRIKISDGRVLVGKLHCFDKHQNLILTDTREYLPLRRASTASLVAGSGAKEGKKGKHSTKQAPLPPQTPEQEAEDERTEAWKSGTSRTLGMALVPGKHIVYIKVERAAYAGTEPSVSSDEHDRSKQS